MNNPSIKQIQNNKSADKIIFFLALLIFSYTLIRAYQLSFTWDESFSYLQFVRNGILFPDKYEKMDANNHLLNTWLNIHLIKYFGVSEFVLRLPSLCSHLLFLFFSYKLVKDFQSIWLVVASFLIINLNPYLLDFFSLSRGYGLSLGLMMTSIYYLFAILTQGYKPKHILLAIIFGLLATLANFVMLNYFLVSFGLIVLLLANNILQTNNNVKQKIIIFLKSATLPVFVFTLSLCFIVPIALKLKEVGALFYGGNKGFWTDTFCTITDRCFYELGYNYWIQRFAKGFVILIFVLASACVGFRVFKKQTTKTNLFLGTLIVLIGLCVLSTIAQYYLFSTLYLIDRTALFFVVLFNLLFVVFINEITKEIKSAGVVIYFGSILTILHFVLAFNLHYVLEWKPDADIKQMIVDLDKIKEIPQGKNTISIAIPLEFDQGINFYRVKDKRTWINTVERSDVNDKRYDYLFISPEEFSKINMDSIEIIKRYPGTNNILAKIKETPNLTKVCFSQQLDFANTKEKMYTIDDKLEYAQGFRYVINDSATKDKNAEVVFTAKVMAEDISKNNLFVIIAFNNSKDTYEWKRACVKDYIVKLNDWVDVYYSVLVPKECVSGDELKSYIWNPNKHSLRVKKMELKWLSKP